MKASFECVITKEGRDKSKMIMNVPVAHGRQLASWGAKTVKRLKMKGGGGILTTQSGHLRRNVGMTMKKGVDTNTLTLGTGIGLLKKVIYASILDKGGTIKAKRKMTFKRKGKTYRFKNGPYLYVPIYGGGARNIGPPKSFRLVKSVRIHPFGWFTKTIKKMRPELNRMMGKKECLKVAKRMK